jgi:hypothetical protein
VSVVQNTRTGKVTVHWTRPPTAMGRCYDWWPSLAGGIVTLVVLALAATHNGRRLVAEFPLPRMTTRRLMIAVAVIAIEASLIINVARNFGGASWDFRDHRRPSPWPLILICLAAPPTLVLLSAFGRTRSTRAEENFSERNQ